MLASNEPLSEPRRLSRSPEPESRSTRKRKPNGVSETDIKAAPKTKRRKSVSADVDLNLIAGHECAIGRMDSLMLADHIAQKIKRFGGDLSLVELDDMFIPEKAIQDTTGWEKQRDLKTLPDFIAEYATKSGKKKNLFSASKVKGAPHTIVITAAGLRAADLTRALRIFQTQDSVVAKLFAKHIRLRDAINYVGRTRMGIAVGTPTRLIDLIDDGALSIEKLERVVVDCSHLDQKKRSILDMKETLLPLIQLLGRESIKNRYSSSDEGIRLLFY